MFMRVVISFLVHHLILVIATSITVYKNAYLDQVEPRYMLGNLSSISSVNVCLCRCYDDNFCSTVTYFGSAQICTLYFGQFNQSQLQLVPTSSNAAVYSIRERNIGNLTLFTLTNETIYALWNTTAGGDSSFASSGYTTGTYWPSQGAENVFDGDLTTDYTNHGMCNYSGATYSKECGENTGFYLTVFDGPKVLVAFYLGTSALYAERDPLTLTIEGSNSNEHALTLGSSWTMIYNGSSGLMDISERSELGMIQMLSNASMQFDSYRLLVTSKRGVQGSAGYSEVQFIFSDI